MIPSTPLAGAATHPETRGQHFAQLFSADECAAILSLAGDVDERVGGTRDIRGQAVDAPDARTRASRIRFLPDGRDQQWVYERVLRAARSANEAPGWGFGSLDSVAPIQVGVYTAEEGGHYDWHADFEDARGSVPAGQSVRIVSMSVQLSAEDAYDGGELQLGLLNMSRGLGDGLAFASNQKHTVHTVSRGVRSSLVAWVRGVPSTAYWEHSLQGTIGLLQKAYAAVTLGDKQTITLRRKRPAGGAGDDGPAASFVPDGLALQLLSKVAIPMKEKRDYEMLRAVTGVALVWHTDHLDRTSVTLRIMVGVWSAQRRPRTCSRS
jgi:hypothetical protein